MRRYILIAVLFMCGATLYPQAPDIGVTVYDVEVTESTVFFRYTVWNGYERSVWLHISGGTSRFYLGGNTIFFEPVSSTTPMTIAVGEVSVKTIMINPGSRYSGSFFRENSPYPIIIINPAPGGPYTVTETVDFSAACFLDLTLIFTFEDTENPTFVRRYREFLSENMILVNRKVRIR